MNGHFQQRLHEIGRGDHVCLVYDNPADQIAAVVPYIKIGLDRRERCLYVADDQTVGEVRRSLDDAGVDVNREIARGALSVLTKRDAYLRFGRFDPDEMVTFLGQSAETTRARGFAALRITGEMTWALGPEVGCDRLIEYEVALNDFFPDSHALAVCQYHRRRFEPAVIRDVLRTHPVAILGNLICSNAYYEPPDIIMRGGDDAQRVDWMIQQLRAAREAQERLIEQAEQLAQSNADLEQFAYVASHDLREPLRITATFSQLLAKKYKDQLDTEAGQILDHIVEGSRRMESLVRDLLAYATVTAPDARSGVRRVDMNRVFAMAVLNLRAAIDETEAVVTHDTLPPVRGNEIQLVQLLQNLVENSINYRKADEPPRIHVEGRYANGQAVFSVRDNGIGIPPEYHAQIFGIFKRLSRDRSGTGIGLALCQRIIDKHRGRIWVESNSGAGSTFFFSIPAEVPPAV